MLQQMCEEKFDIDEEHSLNIQNSFDISETELVIYERRKEGNEMQEALYYVKEMICVNNDIPINYKKVLLSFGNLLFHAYCIYIIYSI